MDRLKNQGLVSDNTEDDGANVLFLLSVKLVMPYKFYIIHESFTHIPFTNAVAKWV